ncbi:MAG: ABC transporter substrate-binding protein, partial [Bradymonadaceae bacterium]
MRRDWLLTVGLAIGLLAGTGGCKDEADDAGAAKKDKKAEADEETHPDAKGVDYENKTIHVGALNDESGAAAAIGKPFAVGKRILVERVNSPETDLLPGNWTLKLHEEDHGYNPSKAVQAYKKLRDDVLFFATSFGTPNTLPLRKFLKKDNVIAFPASLSSKMAAHEYTPPLAPSYKLVAMRAMDFAVQKAGSADKVKAGIVYQKDDYGQDGLVGWKQAAEAHGVEIVAEQTVAAGQKDVTAPVKALKDAGANYVLLTVLPSSTGPILGTAGQLDYTPTWIGNTPAWIDKFFAQKGPLPAKAF